MSPSEAFTEFFNAVVSQDKNAISQFYDKNEFVRAVLPPGRVVEDFGIFLKEQEDWFLDRTRKMKFKLLNSVDCGEYAFGEGRATVFTPDLETNRSDKRDIHMSLLLKRAEKGWVVVTAQNTLLVQAR